MEMTMSDCPVCERKNNTTELQAQTSRYEWDDVKFWCQGEGACEKFVMDGWFLKGDWLTVPLEEKAAIAVYLQGREEPKEPRDPQRWLPRIAKENYQCYVREGKRLQRLLREKQKEGEQAALS